MDCPEGLNVMTRVFISETERKVRVKRFEDATLLALKMERGYEPRNLSWKRKDTH